MVERIEDCYQGLEEHQIIFANFLRHISWYRPVQLFGELINRVERDFYLEVTLDTWLTWSPHTYQVRKKAAQRLGVLDPNKGSGLSIRNGILLQLAHPSSDGLTLSHLEVRRSLPCQEAAGASTQEFSHCYWCTFVHW